MIQKSATYKVLQGKRLVSDEILWNSSRKAVKKNESYRCCQYPCVPENIRNKSIPQQTEQLYRMPPFLFFTGNDRFQISSVSPRNKAWDAILGSRTSKCIAIICRQSGNPGSKRLFFSPSLRSGIVDFKDAITTRFLPPSFPPPPNTHTSSSFFSSLHSPSLHPTPSKTESSDGNDGATCAKGIPF